jgi:hypothetical protein
MLSVTKSSSKKNQSSKKQKSPQQSKKDCEKESESPKKQKSPHQTKKEKCQESKDDCETQSKCITICDLIKTGNFLKNVVLSDIGGNQITFQNVAMFYTLLLEQALNDGKPVDRTYNAHLVNVPGCKGNKATCAYTYQGLELLECVMVFAGLPPHSDWDIQIANDCDYISNITLKDIYPATTSVFNNDVTLQLLHVPFQSVSTLLPEFDINDVCVNVDKGDNFDSPTTQAPYVKSAIAATISGNVLHISKHNVDAILYDPHNSIVTNPNGHTTGVTFLYKKRT